MKPVLSIAEYGARIIPDCALLHPGYKHWSLTRLLGIAGYLDSRLWKTIHQVTSE